MTKNYKNNKFKYRVLFTLLGILFFGFYLSTIINKSAVYEEPAIIASGNYYLNNYNNKINVENPPFLKSLLALPILFMNIRQPETSPELFYTQNPNPDFEYGKEFLFSNNFELILILSRAINIIITIIFALSVYLSISLLLKSRIYALLGFIIFLIMPNIIAHGRLATLDIGVSMLMFAASMMLYKFYLCQKKKWLIYAGVFTGLALLSKYTAILLIPIVLAQTLVLFFISRKKRILNTFIVLLSIFIISSLIICLFYINSNFKLLLFNRHFSSPLLNSVFSNFIMNKIPIFLPIDYMKGFDIVTLINKAAYSSVFLGKFYQESSNIWYYYFVIMFVKIPIPILLLAACGTFCIIKNFYKRKILYFFIIPPIIIFICFSFVTDRQLGIRYILPVYPYLIITVIYAVKQLWELKYKVVNVICCLLIFWIIFTSFYSFPNYLTYFNQFISGASNGYKYFAGSNLDWGQDLPAVENWLKKNNHPKVFFIYFGPTDPALYNIKQEKKPDYIIISVSNLYMLKSKNIFYKFLYESKPETLINNSILIYPGKYITEYNYRLNN